MQEFCLMKLVKESIGFERYKDPKKALGLKYVRPKYQLKDFPGLEKGAEDFMKFDIMDSKRDPGYGYENVFLFLIRFTEDEYNGEYGLCIWDTQKKEFIEEPSTLEDYGITTEEKFERKLGFNVPEDLEFENEN